MRTARKHLQVVETAPGVALEPVSDKYQILFEQGSDAILTISPDGRVDEVNRAVEELTGYLKDELHGTNISVLAPEPGKQRLPDRARALSSDLFAASGTYEDVAIVRKDGYVRLVDVSVRVLEGLAFALFRDVTEKKRMERELITKHSELRNAYVQLEKKNTELQSMQSMLVQAGKMAALGELAAGIAHELNQPLQGIRGYAQELQTVMGRPEASTEAQADLHEIISNVDKMASIIGYLRSFTRKSVENHEFTDVHQRIEEALKMLGRQFQARGITVKREFAQDLPQVYANPLQLEQIFINLATNARDAIEATARGSGEIRIRTRLSGGLIEVEFRDDGCGMSEMTRSKAFNPFFTTKEVGKGMGLGLSLSYGMISKLHGSIVVESEFGKGTAFFIRLPKDFRELA